MTLPALSLITIAIANAAIGAYVWRKRTTSPATRSFAFLAATIASWTLGIALAHHGLLPLTASTRYVFASASLIPLAILLVFYTFPNETHLHPDSIFRVFVGLSLMFTALSLTPVIVRSAKLSFDTLDVDYGALYDFYSIYIVACLAWSLYILVRRYLTSSGLTKLQFRYFVLGLLVPGLGVMTTNLIIPLTLHSSRYGEYGPYFALIFLALTAHVLIRHRFLDIRVVIKRSVILLLALLLSLLGLTALVLSAAAAFRLTFTATQLLVLLGASTIIGVVIHPLRRALIRLLDSYTYRPSTDYPSILRDASNALATILNVDSLTTLIASVVLHAMRVERVALYLHTGSAFTLAREEHYLDVSAFPSPALIPDSSPLVKPLRRSHEPIVTEELSRRPGHDALPVLSELVASRFALLVPVTSEHKLIGILAVGGKLSSDPFFREDIAFLSALAGHATTAIANAHLYQQVVLINEYLNNILRTMDSGVIAISQHHIVTLFNDAAERLTGLTRTSLIGENIDCLPPSLRASLSASISADRSQVQIETTLVDATNRSVPVVCSTSLLRDNTGVTLGAVLVFSDLTALKHLEAQTQQAQRLAALGALASGIAHEIKNPLVAIKTFAELLPERFDEDEFREDFGRVVTAEIDRIDGLVAKLAGLASSRSLQPQLVDIRDPIEDTLTLLRVQLEQQRITVARVLDVSNPYVAGDPAQLKQLFLNIFINALHAMPSEGSLTISIKNGGTPDAQLVLIDISDTGTGIPESLLFSLFDHFVTTKPHGTGLGLAICRTIAELHHATIRASNNTNTSGATISLDLPAACCPLDVSVATNYITPASLRNRSAVSSPGTG